MPMMNDELMNFLLATWNEPLSTVVQPHLYMLRRCVGFSWAQPLCCEKSNASPCVHSVETSHAVLRVTLFCVFGVFPSTSYSGASLLVLIHSGSPARSALFVYLVYFVVPKSTCSPFSCFLWFLWLKCHVKLKKAYIQKEKG